MISENDIQLDQTKNKIIAEVIKQGVTRFYCGDEDVKHFILYVKDTNSAIIAGIVGSHVKNLLKANVAWVKEEKRGQGIGKKLFAKLETYTMAKNCYAIGLNTLHTEGKIFYENLATN